jgi:hypothetical protein
LRRKNEILLATIAIGNSSGSRLKSESSGLFAKLAEKLKNKAFLALLPIAEPLWAI